MRHVALWALVFFALPAYGVDFWVATDGIDDGACGGAADECATIQVATDNACSDDSDLVDDAVIVRDGDYNDVNLDMVSGQDACDGSAGNPFVLKAENVHGATLYGGSVLTGFALCSDSADCDSDIPSGDRGSVYWDDVTVATFGTEFWEIKAAWLMEKTTPLVMATEQNITEEVPQLLTDYIVPDSDGSNTFTDAAIDQTALHTQGAMAYMHNSGANTLEVREITGHSGNVITYDGADFTVAKFDIRNSYEDLTVGEFYIGPDSAGSRRVYIWPRDSANINSEIRLATNRRGIEFIQQSTGTSYWTVQDLVFSGYTHGNNNAVGALYSGLSGAADNDHIVMSNLRILGVRGQAIGFSICDDCIVEDTFIENVMISNNDNTPPGVKFTGTSTPPYTSRVLDNNIVRRNTFTKVEGTMISTFSNDGMCILDNKFIGENGIHGQAMTYYRGMRNLLVRRNFSDGQDRAFAMQDVEGDIWITENVFDADSPTPQSAMRAWPTSGSRQDFDTETDIDGTNDEIDVTGHPWVTPEMIHYSKGSGTEATGLTNDVNYWLRSVTANAVSVHPTEADANADTAKIDLTASGGGSGETHTIRWQAGPVWIWNNVAIGNFPVDPAAVDDGGGITVRSIGDGDDVHVYNNYMYTWAPCGNPAGEESPDTLNASKSVHSHNIFERENADMADGLCGSDSWTIATGEVILDDEIPAVEPEDVINQTTGQGNKRGDYIHRAKGLADDGGVDPETISGMLPSEAEFSHCGESFQAIKDHTSGFNVGAFPITDPGGTSISGGSF